MMKTLKKKRSASCVKKFAALSAALCCMLTPVSGFAKAVKGEVEKIIPYVPYGETTNYNIRLVLPEKYKDYTPEPYTSKYEDGYARWMIYKPVTLDGVFYTWAVVDSFSDEDREYDGKQNVIKEYVLFPGVPPYNQNGVPEIEQINYPAKTTINHYWYMNADASKMRIIIDGKPRSFEKSFYPAGCLNGRDVGGTEAMAKIPMVSIREFVDSVDYLSLVWDNGTIAVTNSKTGIVTNFCIYNRPDTIKAVLLDNTSYASLTDLLIAQLGQEEFNNNRLFSHHTSCGQDLIYIRNKIEDLSENGIMKEFLHTLSLAGILNGYKYLNTFGALVDGFTPDADVHSHQSFKTGLTPWDELEQIIAPEGCVYENAYMKFSNPYNTDIEGFKTRILEATSKGTTDAEKVQLLMKFLKTNIHYGSWEKMYKDISEEQQKAIAGGKFIANYKDRQKLFLLGCTLNNIPSVKLDTVHRTNYGEIVAAYHDGKWNYYDLENIKTVSKDVFLTTSKDTPKGQESEYITVITYTGLSNDAYVNGVFSEEDGNVVYELSRRKSAVGY